MKLNPIKVCDMSPDQLACWQMVCDLVGGEHHAPDRAYRFGRGIKVSLMAGMFSTFDFNLLTTLVFLAHDRCIRVELVSSGIGLIGLALHKRHSRDGSHNDRHPTLAQAVGEFRRFHLEPLEA